MTDPLGDFETEWPDAAQAMRRYVAEALAHTAAVRNQTKVDCLHLSVSTGGGGDVLERAKKYYEWVMDERR